MSRVQRGLNGLSSAGVPNGGNTRMGGPPSLAGIERQGTKSFEELKRLIHGKLVDKLDLSRVSDLEGETLRRVTHGFGGAGEASLASAGLATSGAGAASPSLDAAGGLVAFGSTASNLVRGDGNEASDVFLATDDLARPGAAQQAISAAPAPQTPLPSRSDRSSEPRTPPPCRSGSRSRPSSTSNSTTWWCASAWSRAETSR